VLTRSGLLDRLVIASFAVWRVTHLISHENGPFDVITRMRRRLGDGFFGQIADCFACTSMWVAAPVAVALRPRRRSDLLLSWLALSGAACLLQQRSPDQLPQLLYTDDKESDSHEML
jgi:hypothetical protein